MKTIISIVLLLVNSYSFAQSKSSIRKQAEMYAIAFQKQDYATVIKKTHPSIVVYMGGEENMLKLIKAAMNEVASKGTVIDSVSIGKPGEFFATGNEIYCLVPQRTTEKVLGGRQVTNLLLRN